MLGLGQRDNFGKALNPELSFAVKCYIQALFVFVWGIFRINPFPIRPHDGSIMRAVGPGKGGYRNENAGRAFPKQILNVLLPPRMR